MKKSTIIIGTIITALTVLNGCGATASSEQKNETFTQARQGFQTTIVDKKVDEYPVDAPPEGILETVRFASDVGELDAYITPDPNDDQKHPAIIWIVGGWGNSISSTSWELAPMDNDQSARAFRDAGIVTMYPSRRGGNENTNSMECWYGEIDDIMSAYDYLSKLSYVDPNRIYLGGHSTGGSQAILTAEYSDKFRAVFSFGPKGSVKDSDPSNFTFDSKNPQEILLRSPLQWVNSITTPTYIFEGEEGNADFLKSYINEGKKAQKSDLISGYVIKDADHFSILAPITPLVAQKILADTGEKVNITFTDSELKQAMEIPPIITKEYSNEGRTYQISLSSDWVSYDTGTGEDLSFWSVDQLYDIGVSRYPKDTFESLDEFVNAVIDDIYQEGNASLSDSKDVAINTAKSAKQFICTYEEEYDAFVSNLTMIQTDNAYYIVSIGAYEEDYTVMEKELSAMPLTFKELNQ